VTLAEVARLTRALAGTQSRLEKVALVAAFLQSLAAEEVPWAVSFLAGRPLPAADPRVLSVSGATLRALDEVPPATDPVALTVLEAARAFSAVADAAGAGSRAAKTGILRDLVGVAGPEERRVLFQVLGGEMRTGVHDGLILEAVARAAGVEPALVRRAGLFLSDPAEVARLALAEGEAGLRSVQVRLFVPLLPMLAEPVDDLGEALAAHGGRTGLEVKYDGARIQIHREGDRIRIWSRRLTEVTAGLPEIIEAVRRDVAAAEVILEGEVVAVAADGRPLPFQDLMRRLRRVHEFDAVARQVPVRLYLFDALLADGVSLVDRPYAERWAALAAMTGGRHLAERRITADVGEAEAFLRETLAAGHEGLVAKALDSPYTPGVRGSRWFKLKLADRLDCVIVAADRGSGRRRGWLSNYHLAVRDEADGFADVGKTFKGLTDREFAEMTARLTALAVADDGYTVRVRPEIVVEVAYNEIQPSPRYRSGFALRFARIARIRDDKGPGDADTLGALRARHARQSATKGQTPRLP
jgi:ATP-dependent DNA ligase I